MKKQIVWLLVLSLLLTSLAGGWAAAENAAPVITSVDVPLYVKDSAHKGEMTVSFINGQTDIPYIEMSDAVLALEYIAGALDDNRFDLTLKDDGGVMTLTRENGSAVDIDFNRKEIRYNDFDGFFRLSYWSTPEDVVDVRCLDKDGRPVYISRDGLTSFDRAGDPVGVRLDDGTDGYHIAIYHVDGKGYIPLQTLSDLFCSQMEYLAVYNGQAAFFLNGNDPKDLSDLYYAAPTGERSQVLAEYSYNELRLVLDMFYGLKEAHNIDTFSNLFEQTGLKEELLSADALTADKALYKLCSGYFGDLHSDFAGCSYYAGKQDLTDFVPGYSTSKDGFIEKLMPFHLAREAAYPDGTPAYEEVGNTAYITFDRFSDANDVNADYYATPATADAKDTVGIIMYAQSQIFREGSPVENVVLDLSNNLGGNANAAVYTIGWMLGECSINIVNTLTGARGTTKYMVDTNADHVFDEKDTVASKNLFCLTSSTSFSCGNLVPASLKASGKVTMLGKTTGGGACVVLPISTADGSLLQISGNKRISTVVNGSYYDVDQGVEPDVTITRYADYYDRQKLTDFINNLF